MQAVRYEQIRLNQPDPAILAALHTADGKGTRAASDAHCATGDCLSPTSHQASQGMNDSWFGHPATIPPQFLQSLAELLAQQDGPEVELSDPDMRPEEASDDRYSYQEIDGDVFVDGVSAGDIGQGFIADCYFMAALASLAHTNPQAVMDMITDNGNGTYTVHFGGDIGDVTVDDDFVADQNGNLTYAQAGDGATPELWVAIIQKAFAQAEGGYAAIEYGRANEAIAELTGFTDFTTAPPSSFTPAQIEAALANGQSVTVSSYNGDKGDKVRDENNIVANHAYVVLDVRVVDGETQVRVMNPWGHTEQGADGANDGAFWMSWEDFQSSFREVQMMNQPLSEAA